MSDEILELAQELSEVSRLVAADDVTSTLSRFVSRVVQTVADCDEASVSVLTNGEPEIVARHHRIAEAVAEPSRAALGAQLIASTSPLRDALQYGEPHRIGRPGGRLPPGRLLGRGDQRRPPASSQSLGVGR